MAERESALKVRLELDGTAAHVPRAVRKLRREKIFDSAPICGVADLHDFGFCERDECSPGCVRIALQIRIAGPASIGALHREQRLGRIIEILFCGVSPGEARQPHGEILRGDWLLLFQPPPGASNPFREFLLPCWDGILLENPYGPRGSRKVTLLDGRTVLSRAGYPAAVRLLRLSQIYDRRVRDAI